MIREKKYDDEWIGEVQIRTRNLGGDNWQWAKHTRLYSDLPQVLKGEHLSAREARGGVGGYQQRGLQFLRPQYPTVGKAYENITRVVIMIQRHWSNITLL